MPRPVRRFSRFVLDTDDGFEALYRLLTDQPATPQHAIGDRIVLRRNQDQAWTGWHGAKTLRVPDVVTLVPLPPYSTELNPVERLWLYLRERFLSLRIFPNYDAIVDACCRAWNSLAANPGRIASLCNYPWIATISS